MKSEVIIFGGGCFWCTEAVFKMLKGVISVGPGYAGGRAPADGKSPTYKEVSGGDTGHAEVIKIEYDPEVVSLKTLLTVFFASHDPTTKNRQGNDIGSQYRSIILLCRSEAQKGEGGCDPKEQRKIVEQFIKDLNNSSQLGAPITTEVKPLDVFYPAENYHKNYYENNKGQAYCQVVINPS